MIALVGMRLAGFTAHRPRARAAGRRPGRAGHPLRRRAGPGRRGVRGVRRDAVPGARLADQDPARRRAGRAASAGPASPPAGPTARLLAGLGAAFVAALPMIVIALVLPWLLGGVTTPQRADDPPLAEGIALGVWAHVLAARPGGGAGRAGQPRGLRQRRPGPAGTAPSAWSARSSSGCGSSPVPWLAPPVMADRPRHGRRRRPRPRAGRDRVGGWPGRRSRSSGTAGCGATEPDRIWQAGDAVAYRCRRSSTRRPLVSPASPDVEGPATAGGPRRTERSVPLCPLPPRAPCAGAFLVAGPVD